MPTSVLRRYTPPTCTLEIAANGSALSRWTDRAVLKNLRFQLSFDDPKVAEDKQVTIRGDRNQLEALWEAVSTYVQTLLNQLPAENSGSRHFQAALPDQEENSGLRGVALSTPDTATGIQLHPKGLVTHELRLGTLANERSGEIVPLSVLQLFDLANALDEYHAEALSLPALNRPSWLKSPNQWASIAAVALLAIGATTAVTKFMTDVSSTSTQVATAPEENANPDQQAKSSVRLPAPPGVEPLPSSLALQPLPPPPPAGATKTAPPAPPVTVTQAPPASTGSAAPSAPVLLPDPTDLSGGQVAVVPAPGQASSTAEVPADLQASNPAGEAPTVLPNSTLRAAVPESADSAQIAQSEGAQGESTQTATNSTAFDAIPQVAEVRNYFQQTWQPPDELTQTLEYRLVLNSNGSIQRIVPLGQAAATFLDRTEMPLMNEPFVSPVESGSNPQIRLVLGRDGRVQTFLEAP
jgi:hypothetical protein